MYKIRLQIVRTANDDGSEAATVTPAGVTAAVDTANEIYAALAPSCLENLRV